MGNHRGVKIFTIALFFGLLAGSANALTLTDCDQLSRNLKAGMGGVDVRILQQILNLNKATQISITGVGSPGNETSFFGGKTKAAVMKFQELYAQDILIPAQLLRGNGYVGSFSRTKLVSVCRSQFASANANTPSATTTVLRPNIPMITHPINPTVPASSSPATSGSAISLRNTTAPASISQAGNQLPVANSSFASKKPVLIGWFTPSQYAAPRGTKITISTVGTFTGDVVVHLDTFTIAKPTIGQGDISFVIPSDAPRGRHDLWVSSTEGDTNKLFFVVSDPAIPGPKVTSFTPQQGFLGTKVTVTGTGFLPNGNDVHISYGVIANVPSADGKTLEFNVMPSIPGLQVGEDRPEVDLTAPYWFSIVNDNGVSESSVFNLKV